MPFTAKGISAIHKSNKITYTVPPPPRKIPAKQAKKKKKKAQHKNTGMGKTESQEFGNVRRPYVRGPCYSAPAL